MEDITAALCLDNRLQRRLYPTLLANTRIHRIWVFFYPPVPSSAPFSSSLPNSLHFGSPVLPLIHLSVVFSICQWCMPAGGAPNPLSGRTTASLAQYTIERGKGEEVRSSRKKALETRLWACVDKFNTVNTCVVCKLFPLCSIRLTLLGMYCTYSKHGILLYGQTKLRHCGIVHDWVCCDALSLIKWK